MKDLYIRDKIKVEINSKLFPFSDPKIDSTIYFRLFLQNIFFDDLSDMVSNLFKTEV